MGQREHVRKKEPSVATSDTLLIDKLLHAVVRQGASDLHITVGQPPVIRHDGHMVKLKTKVLEPADTMQLDEEHRAGPLPAGTAGRGRLRLRLCLRRPARFRVSIFKQRGNMAMVLRQIPDQAADHGAVGAAGGLRADDTRPRGLFLVTGPTGSGKSTSLASMINYLNENFDHHIITIEDPIEFFHPNKKSTVNQREVGVDVPSFAEALRRALRQDPDVILVGELRDLATIEAAISAAETGHIVFGTLHTTGAQGTVNRIIDVFPTTQQDQIRTQLSTSIIGVLSQTLLPKIGGGRVAAHELLVCNSAVANLIRENKTFRITSAIQTGAKQGMMLLDDALFDLWRKQLVAKEDLLAKAAVPDELAARIANAERGMFDDDDDVDRKAKDEREK